MGGFVTSKTEIEQSTWTPRQIWMLTVSCCAVALVVAAMAALNTALPDIARDTGATQTQLTWIVDGYTLVLACLLLAAGALGDRYGRRELLMFGLVVFAAGSAIPVFIDEPSWIIASRVVSGVGAAFVMPATLSLLTAGFPATQRSRAVGVWSGVAGSGAIAGLVISGFLIEKWSWHSIFISLAVVSGLILVASFTIASSKDEETTPLDFLGTALIATAIGLFVLGMIEAPVRGWLNPVVLALLIGGIATGVVFSFVELRSAHPLLDVGLFANRAFGSSATSLVLQFLATFGMFFMLVQYLQLVLDYSPLQSALALLPMAVPVMALSVVSPLLIPLVGLRILTSVGIALLGTGIALVTRLELGSSYVDVCIPLIVAAIGLGLCTTPATAAIVSNTPDAKQGVASAINDVTREIGSAIGVALAGSILATTYARHVQPAVDMLPEPAKEPVSGSLAAALHIAESAGSQGDQLADFAREAFIEGMNQAALTLAVIIWVSAVILGFWAPGRQKTAKALPSESTAAPLA
ncbi:MFS transporter [Rhodococcus sp. ACPA4]|uniref:MFS transporter n=1 Tax=Rhodococcus globerulus TaxID=33008 RepID=A0ABU4C194_RHOGO|nr:MULTISPECIES: MFS transporter [Rhodococcus]NMD60403.1 MFS transporter [Nocardia globerula]MCE4268790.1 MFS transporter [Rhodococcus globerulus]MDV6270277.1 MFS transporter [Rhodococcus globerulus]PBC42861.1 MFS transporter [Rhodococcus sp. ACPA4]PSR42384.1 MFS transporter [Rhodococcus sp. AD45-ID]